MEPVIAFLIGFGLRIVLPVGVTQSGAWRYAFAYDLVTRHFPALPEQARFIQDRQARRELALRYLRSVGAAQLSHLVRLFGWTGAQAGRAVDELVKAGEMQRDLELENQAGEWLVVPELVPDH